MTKLELQEKREAVKIDALKIYDLAINEKRELTDLEETELRSFESQIKNFDNAIKIAPEEKRSIPVIEVDTEIEERSSENEVEKRYFNFLKNEERSLSTNSGANTPRSVENKIYTVVGELSPIRSASNVIPVTGNTEILVGSADVAAGFVAEGGSITPDDSTVQPVSLTPHKLAGIVRVSEEFLNDSPQSSVMDYITRVIAQKFAKIENQYFVTGTGTAQPQGVITGASTGVTTASSTAITATELREFLLSLDMSLMAGSMGLCSPSTMAKLWSLADADSFLNVFYDKSANCYLINGIPFYTNNYVEDIAAGKKVAVIGDFKNYYAIAQRQGVETQVLNELYKANGQVGIKYTTRLDGKVIDSNAFKTLVMKSA